MSLIVDARKIMAKRYALAIVRSLVIPALLVAGPLAVGAAEPEVYQTENGPIRVVTLAQDLENPWGLAFLPDRRMLVTERPGRLRIVGPDGTVSAPLKGIPEVYESGQGGLLDVAIDPDFARNRLVYFSYSESEGRVAATAVARGRLTNDRLNDVQVIFRQRPKVGGSNHFGSRLVFAPDGTLFVALGERFQRDRAQNLNETLGKVVHINADGSIPSDNPFVGHADVLPEIWSLGHRNVQGAALNPETNRLWTIEHGAQGGDEINIPEAGKNYGWPIITYGIDYSGARIGEGTAKAGLEQPIYYWDPSIAPSGATFYTGERFPAWRGNLLVGSLKFELLVRLELDGNRVVREERLLEGLDERVRDVREGPDGSLYLLTDSSDGRLVRLEPAS